MACDRQLEALADCYRKHPRQADLVCTRVKAAVTWCIMSQLCPEQGVALLVGRTVGCTKLHAVQAPDRPTDSMNRWCHVVNVFHCDSRMLYDYLEHSACVVLNIYGEVLIPGV